MVRADARITQCTPDRHEAAVVAVLERLGRPVGPETQRKRLRLAAYCKFVAAEMENEAVRARLSPRVRQTLDRLLRGDSEKQVAIQLRLSQHTVHVHVKSLYRKLNVTTRGELLAKFVRPGA